ncbi:hypothetical protein [Micromonospora sp. NPDC049282]
MREGELRDLVQRSPWLIRALGVVRDSVTVRFDAARAAAPKL